MQRRNDGIIILRENETVTGIGSSGFEGIIVDTRFIKDRINVFKGQYINDTNQYKIITLATIQNQEEKSLKDVIDLVKRVIDIEKPAEFEFGIPEIAVTQEF